MSDGDQQRTQQGLVDFLRTDLDLCFTMLDTASITDDPDHFAAAITHVTRGIETIRDFLDRVQDRNTWQEINSRVNSLESRMFEVNRP